MYPWLIYHGVIFGFGLYLGVFYATAGLFIDLSSFLMCLLVFTLVLGGSPICPSISLSIEIHSHSYFLQDLPRGLHPIPRDGATVEGRGLGRALLPGCRARMDRGWASLSAGLSAASANPKVISRIPTPRQQLQQQRISKNKKSDIWTSFVRLINV